MEQIERALSLLNAQHSVDGADLQCVFYLSRFSNSNQNAYNSKAKICYVSHSIRGNADCHMTIG